MSEPDIRYDLSTDSTRAVVRFPDNEVRLVLVGEVSRDTVVAYARAIADGTWGWAGLDYPVLSWERLRLRASWRSRSP